MSGLNGLQVVFCPENGLDPVLDVDFLEDVVQVGFDGVRADAKMVGNGIIRYAAR